MLRDLLGALAFVAGIAVMSAVLMLVAGCAGATPGLPTQADFSAYAIQQGVCIQANDTKATTLACVAAERRTFCHRFPATCPPDDGGAE
jgi:hypothetical protein